MVDLGQFWLKRWRSWCFFFQILYFQTICKPNDSFQESRTIIIKEKLTMSIPIELHSNSAINCLKILFSLVVIHQTTPTTHFNTEYIHSYKLRFLLHTIYVTKVCWTAELTLASWIGLITVKTQWLTMTIQYSLC